MALIRVEAAHKRYGSVVALDNVTLEVEEGACVALIGESGSGKTTLLRTINALTALDSGHIRVRGRDVTEAHRVPADAVALRRSIGYVQQDGGLIPHWTARKNAGLVPTLLGRADAEAAAESALSSVGLPAEQFGERFPRELSGGQRQRVAIARAMAASPDLLLLDEPFGALDAITRSDVQTTFAKLREATGVTAVLVTHDLREALALATRIAVIREGRIVENGAPAHVTQSEVPYVRELLEKAGVA